MPERFRPPQFLREFSKDHDQEGRDETARTIREKRAEFFEQKEIETRISTLELKLSDLDSGFISRFRNRAEIRAKKEELIDLKGKVSQDSESEGEESDEFTAAREILDSYYERQKRAWSEAGYTIEDVRHYFNEENLEKLNVDEYGLLLSRFPAEMATHATRQGVRDHTGMMEHRAGLGEFNHGFVDILEDGRLRSLVGKVICAEKKDEILGEYFKWYVDQIRKHCPWLESISDKEILEDRLDKGDMRQWDSEKRGFYPKNAGSYTDWSALHMARDVVLDSYYGGEYDNEFFFCYPMANFYAEHDFTDTHSDKDPHNDLWLWTKDQRGLSVDAALTFIPKNTQVDRITGSRYQLDSEFRPIVAEERLNKVVKLLKDKDFIVWLESFCSQTDSRFDLKFDDKQRFESELRGVFGISDKNTIGAILAIAVDLDLRNDFRYREVDRRGKPVVDFAEKFGASLLNVSHCYFKEAEDAISSEEFWENYFIHNPNLRPSKIVYYTGDPTKALQKWQGEHRINNYGKKSLIDAYTEEEDPEDRNKKRWDAALQGHKEYYSICKRVIDKYFSN